MHAALVANRDRIAKLIIAEVGCAQGITHAMQVDAPLSHFASALAHSASDDRRYFLWRQRRSYEPHGAAYSRRRQRGPRADGRGRRHHRLQFPFLVELAKIVPVLLAGNTLVLKPSPFTPYSALLFGEIAEEIGLPKGVLNIVTGGDEVGSLLSSQPTSTWCFHRF